jgi:hypothetical protein
LAGVDGVRVRLAEEVWNNVLIGLRLTKEDIWSWTSLRCDDGIKVHQHLCFRVHLHRVRMRQ